MAEVSTTLSLTAVDKTQTAFAQAAANVERFTQRATRAQKEFTDHTTHAIRQIEESGRAGMETLEKMAGLLGGAVGVETIREGVVEWAKLEETFNRIQSQTGKSREEMERYYDRLKELGRQTGTNTDDLVAGFEKLAGVYGGNQAMSMMDTVAKAARGSQSSIEDTTGALLIMNQALGITPDKAEKAFEAIESAEKSAGGTLSSGSLMKAIKDLGEAFGGAGQSGQTGLNRTLAVLEGMSKTMPNAGQAANAWKGLLEGMGSRRWESAQSPLMRWTNLRGNMEEARRNGGDLVVTFVNSVRTAIKNMKESKGFGGADDETLVGQLLGTGRGSQMAVAMTAILHNLETINRAQRELNAETDKGIFGKRFAEENKTTDAQITRFLNNWREAREILGRRLGVPLFEGIQIALKDIEAHTPTWLKNWLETGHAAPTPETLTGPAKMTGLRADFKAGRGGGIWHDIKGDAGDIGQSRPRILVPTEPGSATEQTAKDQLRVLLDLYNGRGSTGGAGIGGSSGSGLGGMRGGGGGGTGGGGQSGGGEYNVSKAYDLMKQAGATDEEARTLAAISQAESSGNPNVVNRKGEHSVGLWQINMRAHGTKYGSEAELQNPLTNARAALALSRQNHGYGDWTTYTSGAYRRFMPTAGGVASGSTGVGATRSAGTLTVGGETFHYGSGGPSAYPNTPPGDYTLQGGFDPSARGGKGGFHVQNYYDPRVGRTRAGIEIHESAQNNLDQIRTLGCLAVPAAEWPALKRKLQADLAAHGGRENLHIDEQGNASIGSVSPSARDHHSALQREFNRRPIKVAMEIDRPGIRDRGEAQGRRTFAREARDSRYRSYSDVGVG